ncbi:MFS transporter [Levilactobacillus zymae]|uniref:MFS transporter n=1 Tax=Levilactobacillus zymae TaxID=267363 RepID=A0ABQ0WU47_9LACO|nr:MFS transporter [Levilactobacillus zymae]GEO71280.1 MFS transporter [Levilactobacillus zymae]
MSKPETAEQRLFSRDTILLLICTFCYMCSSMLITPLIVGFTHSLGASTLVAGIVAAAMNLCSLVFRPFAGQLVDAVTKYKIALIGGSLLLVATVGYAVAVTPWMVVIFRIINGFGFALSSICLATWFSSLLPRDRIGAGMSYYGMMNALGMAVAPALGIWIFHQVSYRAAFLCGTVFSATIVILIQFVINKGRPYQRPNQTQAPTAHHRIVQPRVVPLAIILMLLSIPYFATQSYIVEYVAVRHLQVSAGNFFIVYAIILLAVRLVFKDYFDRVPFKWFLLIGSFCNLIGMLGLTYLVNNWMMVLAAAGLAGGYGVMYSVCQATALLLAPLDEQGLANSTFYIGMDTGMVLGPIIGGALFDAVPVTLFYPALLVTIPLTAVVYVIFHRQLAVKAQNA